eukprot:4943274-Prymnesium_polylepis.1
MNTKLPRREDVRERTFVGGAAGQLQQAHSYITHSLASRALRSFESHRLTSGDSSSHDQPSPGARSLVQTRPGSPYSCCDDCTGSGMV